MGERSNKAIVEDFLAAQDAADLERQRALLHDQVTLHIPKSGAIVGAARANRGIEAYIAVRRDLLPKLYKEGRVRTMKALMADGDLVAAFYHLSTELTAGGDYENDYAFLYRLEDGKIIEIWEYADSAHSYLQYGYRITKA